MPEIAAVDTLMTYNVPQFHFKPSHVRHKIGHAVEHNYKHIFPLVCDKLNNDHLNA